MSERSWSLIVGLAIFALCFLVIAGFMVEAIQFLGVLP